MRKVDELNSSPVVLFKNIKHSDLLKLPLLN